MDQEIKSYIDDRIQQLFNGNFDMRGKRIINAAAAVGDRDYVTKGELRKGNARFFFGTLNPSQLPANPLPNDVFISTDFLHTYIYNSGWKRLGVARFVGWFPTAPGTGWHLCDGSGSVIASKDDGTTELITVPTLNAKVVMRFDASYSGPIPTAAVAPTINAHHHSVVVPDQNSGSKVTGISVDSHGTAANTAVTGAETRLISPTTHTVTDPGHFHDVPSQTFNSANTTATANADGHDKLMDGLPYIRL